MRFLQFHSISQLSTDNHVSPYLLIFKNVLDEGFPAPLRIDKSLLIRKSNLSEKSNITKAKTGLFLMNYEKLCVVFIGWRSLMFFSVFSFHCIGKCFTSDTSVLTVTCGRSNTKKEAFH